MRLCYIGPAQRADALRTFLSPGVELEARPRPTGPQSIESMWEEYLAAPAYMEMALQLEREGFDAVIPGCFGDPGLDGIREVVSIPVVGVGSAGIHVAASLGHRFSIISPISEAIRLSENLVRAYHLESKLASVVALDIPVLELNGNPDATFERAVEVGREAIERDRADVLVTGCGTLSFRAEELQAALGVPVVNPLRAALRMAELLVSSGLSHSKRSYPTPRKIAEGLVAV
ncbi:MAG: aspartate/glutamate racemase family protein [Thermomicrobiales bacterium]|nr:aspartate/glutamate racemase family protein [Thermomicrobiales bacterium]